jgi:hypothetical protein
MTYFAALPDPDNDAEVVRFASNLLYEPDDPRATAWPAPADLGRLRSWLRGLADELEEERPA